MADNINVVAQGGTTKTLQTTDNTTYHTPAHQIVRADGTVPLKIVAEDAAHTSADTGISAMVVRQDTPGNLSGTDGDYEMLQVSAGRLWISGVVTDVVPGTTATKLGKAEDAAHTTGDTGVFVLAVRNDTHTNALAGTDGDYTPIQVDSAGKVGIRGTFAEDAAHTSTDLGVQVLTVRQDTAAALSGTDADYQPFITDASGRLWVNAGAVGTITPGTAATSLGKAEDAAHSSADVGVFCLAVRSDTATVTSGTDGDYSAFIVDASGRLHVNVGAFTPGTAAGSLGKAEDAAHTSGDTGVFFLAVRSDTAAATGTTDGDYVALITNSTGHLWTTVNTIVPGTGATHLGKAEDAAHTSGDVGVMMLSVRQDAAAALAGTDADYQPLITDSAGRLHTRAKNDGPAWTTVNGASGAAVTSADASATVSVTDAPTGGQKLVITELTVSVGSALTVTFEEETSGTDFLKLYMAANTTQTFKWTSKQKLGTADKKLQVTTSGAGNISVRASYYSEA